MSNADEITIRLPRFRAEHIRDLLDRELAAHHNRLEDYVLWGSTDRITEAAEAARSTRNIRAHINRALGS